MRVLARRGATRFRFCKPPHSLAPLPSGAEALGNTDVIGTGCGHRAADSRASGYWLWAAHRLFIQTTYAATQGALWGLGLTAVVVPLFLVLTFFLGSVGVATFLSWPRVAWLTVAVMGLGALTTVGVLAREALRGSDAQPFYPTVQSLGRSAGSQRSRRGASACAYSPDGSTVVGGFGDGALKLWDAAALAERTTISRYWQGGWRWFRATWGAGDIGVNACGFSPDGTRILAGYGDGTARGSSVVGVEGGC